MPRPPRVSVPYVPYHVLNRGNGRMTLFEEPADYEAFERVFELALHRFDGICLLAYCVMPNHWHLVLYPTEAGLLSTFMAWLSQTHAQRWLVHRGKVGTGHVYQDRFRSFPVQPGRHFATVARYVERNPLRAGLVERAEAWRWSSLWRTEYGSPEQRGILTPWTIAGWERPPDWLKQVQAPQTEAEYAAVQTCRERGRPLGDPVWRDHLVRQHGLEPVMRPARRPRILERGPVRD